MDPGLTYLSGIRGTKFSIFLKTADFLFQTVSNCFTTVSRNFVPQIAEKTAFLGLRRGRPQRPDALRGELLNQQSGRSRNSGDVMGKRPRQEELRRGRLG
jgi:hypothetical protein